MAVHVSPDGRDLVVVTWEGWVAYMPDFAVSEPQHQTRQGFRLFLNTDLAYMAFDGKRILLATVSALGQGDAAQIFLIISVTFQGSGFLSIPVLDQLRLREDGEHGAAQVPPRDLRIRNLESASCSHASCVQLFKGSAWMTRSILRIGSLLATRTLLKPH